MTLFGGFARLKSALTAAIYNKSLRLTSSEKAKLSVGETVNLIQIDTQKIQDLINNLNTAWASPLQIAFSLYFLWGILGVASFAGVGVMVAIIPINAFLSKKMRKYQFDNMTKKDRRIKTMNEILDGIKVRDKYFSKDFSCWPLIRQIRRYKLYGLADFSFCT